MAALDTLAVAAADTVWLIKETSAIMPLWQETAYRYLSLAIMIIAGMAAVFGLAILFMQIRYSEGALRKALKETADETRRYADGKINTLVKKTNRQLENLRETMEAMVEGRMRRLDAHMYIDMAHSTVFGPHHPDHITEEEMGTAFDSFIEGLSKLRWDDTLDQGYVRYALTGLVRLVMLEAFPVKDSPDRLVAFENAVSSVGKIQRTHGTDQIEWMVVKTRERLRRA